MKTFSFLVLTVVGVAYLQLISGGAAAQTQAREGVTVGALPATDSIKRSCRIDYAERLEIPAPLTGVMQFYVSPADAIEQGDVLGEFDGAALERRLKLLQAQVGLIENRMAREEAELSTFRRALHQSSLDRLTDDLRAQVERQDRTQTLVAEGKLSVSNLDEVTKLVASIKQQISDLETRFAVSEVENDLQRDQQAFELLSLNLEIEEVEEQKASAIVTAPASGIIAEAFSQLDIGRDIFVRQGLTLMSITDPTRLSTTIKVTQEDMRSIQNSTVNVINPNTLDQIPGSISDVKAIEQDTFSTAAYEVELQIDVPAENDWIIGSDATCIFKFPVNAEGHSVPVNMIKFDVDGPFVTVVVPDGVTETRRVQLGREVDGLVEILSGLTGDEKLVM